MYSKKEVDRNRLRRRGTQVGTGGTTGDVVSNWLAALSSVCQVLGKAGNQGSEESGSSESDRGRTKVNKRDEEQGEERASVGTKSHCESLQRGSEVKQEEGVPMKRDINIRLSRAELRCENDLQFVRLHVCRAISSVPFRQSLHNTNRLGEGEEEERRKKKKRQLFQTQIIKLQLHGAASEMCFSMLRVIMLNRRIPRAPCTALVTPLSGLQASHHHGMCPHPARSPLEPRRPPPGSRDHQASPPTTPHPPPPGALYHFLPGFCLLCLLSRSAAWSPASSIDPTISSSTFSLKMQFPAHQHTGPEHFHHLQVAAITRLDNTPSLPDKHTSALSPANVHPLLTFHDRLSVCLHEVQGSGEPWCDFTNTLQYNLLGFSTEVMAAYVHTTGPQPIHASSYSFSHRPPPL
ncbi:unnamed protein product [Pleuronectes platessa]|uniref:Uncharacterized protein n=1 Tax=Pleuronectes platessa TaxID=8262 RepID=A0A9N7ZB91_PLEPL|nr:unnamed protein product [Pleuronectes platessa]